MPRPDPNRERSYDGDMMTLGKDGESVVYDFLHARTTLQRVEDVREDPQWQQRDVDFIAHHATGQTLVEAKTDTWMGRTGYVLFEFARIYHTSPAHPIKLGWSVTSEADVFCIWAPSMAWLYAITAVHLRDAMRQYTRQARKKTRISFIETDAIKSTLNFLIPLSYVQYRAYGRKNGLWYLAQNSQFKQS